MDSDEQRLRDEVIYLHSLWHQGPPRKTNTNPNPNPRPISKSSRTLHQTSISKTFKNTTTKKHKTKPKKLEKAKKLPESDPQPPASGAEWPVQPISDQLSGWSKSPSLPTARPATAEEEAKLIALQIQEKGLAACREFFSRNESDDDDDDVDDDDLEEDGCEEFEFFVGLFSKDAELRSYYEKNNEGGIFCCLVCGGMGKKVGKRYKDCVGLVQHSSAISKTNKKRAHRSYGHVICRVLGWDVNRLPTIALKAGDHLPQGGELQGNSNGNTDNLDSTDDNLKSVIKDQNVDMDEVKGNSSDNADNLNVVVEDSNANGVELKDSLEEGKDSKLGDLDKGVSDATPGELDFTVPIKEDGVEPESKDSQEVIIVFGGANGGTSGVDLQQ
ncbi:uncharacterized protein LOC117909584 [Vitis riparia]|uniref:uncharacterized protein LOC117909584 n=1 Tax=Vitis riparia TaxID=96939 RepID=UPI00155A7678|nr:uncharacterized protein LOC117909584 [Vitis riparia]